MSTARPLIDRDEIQRWSEERKATPACVKGTGGKGDTGMIRLDFPGYSGGDSLVEISWEDWFKTFEDRGLALLVQDKTADGQRSNFNKLVSRDSVRNESGEGTGHSTSKTTVATPEPEDDRKRATRKT